MEENDAVDAMLLKRQKLLKTIESRQKNTSSSNASETNAQTKILHNDNNASSDDFFSSVEELHPKKGIKKNKNEDNAFDELVSPSMLSALDELKNSVSNLKEDVEEVDSDELHPSIPPTMVDEEEDSKNMKKDNLFEKKESAHSSEFTRTKELQKTNEEKKNNSLFEQDPDSIEFDNEDDLFSVPKGLSYRDSSENKNIQEKEKKELPFETKEENEVPLEASPSEEKSQPLCDDDAPSLPSEENDLFSDTRPDIVKNINMGKNVMGEDIPISKEEEKEEIILPEEKINDGEKEDILDVSKDNDIVDTDSPDPEEKAKPEDEVIEEAEEKESPPVLFDTSPPEIEEKEDMAPSSVNEEKIDSFKDEDKRSPPLKTNNEPLFDKEDHIEDVKTGEKKTLETSITHDVIETPVSSEDDFFEFESVSEEELTELEESSESEDIDIFYDKDEGSTIRDGREDSAKRIDRHMPPPPKPSTIPSDIEKKLLDMFNSIANIKENLPEFKHSHVVAQILDDMGENFHEIFRLFDKKPERRT